MGVRRLRVGTARRQIPIHGLIDTMRPDQASYQFRYIDSSALITMRWVDDPHAPISQVLSVLEELATGRHHLNNKLQLTKSLTYIINALQGAYNNYFSLGTFRYHNYDL